MTTEEVVYDIFYRFLWVHNPVNIYDGVFKQTKPSDFTLPTRDLKREHFSVRFTNLNFQVRRKSVLTVKPIENFLQKSKCKTLFSPT